MSNTAKPELHSPIKFIVPGPFVQLDNTKWLLVHGSQRLLVLNRPVRSYEASLATLAEPDVTMGQTKADDVISGIDVLEVGFYSNGFTGNALDGSVKNGV